VWTRNGVRDLKWGMEGVVSRAINFGIYVASEPLKNRVCCEFGAPKQFIFVIA